MNMKTKFSKSIFNVNEINIACLLLALFMSFILMSNIFLNTAPLHISNSTPFTPHTNPNNSSNDSDSSLLAAAREKLIVKDEDTIFKGEAVKNIKMPSADGKVTANNDLVDIDVSNASEGYVMIKYKGEASSLIRMVNIVTPNSSEDYRYVLNIFNEYVSFPLTEGDGVYKIQVFEQAGTKFALKNATEVKVTLKDDYTHYTYPHYYVNYNSNSKAVKMAQYLCKDITTELGKVEKVYNYVIDNMKYDTELAANVQSGYVPDLDRAMVDKDGICFDYSSLMTAMLRSVGIPTKMVFGYAGTIYHAWISTYIKDIGWVDGIIQFDGKSWKLMDPTFASASNSSKSIMEYIGDGNNYQTRFVY